MEKMVDGTALKPCPFCGSEAKVCRGTTNPPYFWVECEGCYASTMGAMKPTEAEAIEAWNRRVATDSNVGDKERTAKVICRGTTMGLSFCCGNCGKPVHSEGEYCHHCGARLELK